LGSLDNIEVGNSSFDFKRPEPITMCREVATFESIKMRQSLGTL
jgi:hypothetical protein